MQSAKRLPYAGPRPLVLYATSRNGADPKIAVAETQRVSIEILPAKLSLADPESVASLVSTVRTTHGGCDVLINNAGLYYFQENITPAQRKETLDVNYRGTLRVSSHDVEIVIGELMPTSDVRSIHTDHAREGTNCKCVLAVRPAQVFPS